MNSNNKVACPLDCYDACQAEKLQDGTIKGSKEHKTTDGKLCVKFANLLKEEKLEKSYFQNEEISLETGLSILVDKLKNTTPSKLYFIKVVEI